MVYELARIREMCMIGRARCTLLRLNITSTPSYYLNSGHRLADMTICGMVRKRPFM